MAIALEDDSDAFTAALCFVDEFMGAGTDEAALSVALEGLPPLPELKPRRNSDCSSRSAPKKRKQEQLVPRKAVNKAPKTSRSSTRNRVRDQERRELLYLREKVADMQQKLQALEKTRTPMLVHSLKEEEKDDSGKEDEEAPAVWKEMASHQLEQRLKSERENRQLKMVLEGQIKIAKSLEKLLQARATTNAIENCLGDGPRLKRMHVSAPERSDASIFEELMAGVDSAYKEVDTVFHDYGLDTIESSFNDAEMHEANDGVYMKIIASKVLPFDVPSTGTAAWKYFSRSMEHMPFRFLYHKDLQNMEKTDDTIIESFGMELHAKGTQADYRVKQIVRRYVEETRVVIVWRSFIDPVSFAGSPVHGAEFQEKGFLVVRRPSAMSPRFALLQTCYLISPALPIRSLSDERAVTGELTDFVLSGTEANVASCHQMIENILFNEAMKAHSRG